MALRKKIITGTLAALALVASAAAAYAAPAYATGTVNVRSGPSTGYSIVDSLRRGEQVDVQECRGGWCYIAKRGTDGWVSANYLSQGGYDRYDRRDDYDRYDRRDRGRDHWTPGPSRPGHWDPRPTRPAPVYPTYPQRPGGQVCVNGPNGYFCVGN